jgi:hypothetical protein
MCRCLHLLRHTHLPATNKIECPRTSLVRRTLILPERLLHPTTGKAGLTCLPSIKDAQTGHDHYLWLTHLTRGLVSRSLLHLPRRDIHRVDLFLRVQRSTRACPIMIKLRNIMPQVVTGLGWHSTTRANLQLALTGICLQHQLISTHQPGPRHPEEPHPLGLW